MKTYKISFDGLTFIVELTEEERATMAQDEEITIKEVIA